MITAATPLPSALERDDAPSTLTWAVWAALCAFTLLNANSVAVLAGAPSRLFNPLLLVSALWVLAANRRELRFLGHAPMPAVWVFGVVYLGVGLFSATQANEIPVEQAIERLPQYFATLLLLLAGATMALAAERAGRTTLMLVLMFIPAVFASLSGVILVGVPAFANVLDLLPGERLHGVFGNVNELGAQAGFALILGLALSMRTKRLGWFVLGATCGIIGAVSSFSKSAMLGFLPLLALAAYAASGAKVRLRPMLMLAVGGVVLAVATYGLTAMLLDGRLGIELTVDQRLRLETIMEIIGSGSLSENATTGRAAIWGVAFERWGNAPILGLGLSAFDRVRGVDMEVHSTVLRVLGESGVVGMIAFLIMVAAFSIAAIRAKRTDVHVLALGFGVVQLPAVISLGYIMVSRNHNIVTGCVLGLLVSLAAKTSAEEPAAAPLPAAPDPVAA